MAKECLGPFIYKSLAAWEANKMMRVETMKLELSFLAEMGNDISFCKNVDILGMIETLRNIFTKLESIEREEILDPLLVLCNNIISLPASSQAGRIE